MINQDNVQTGKSKAKIALAALQRAADQARNIAIQTNTEIVILQDGKRVRVTAEELRQQASKQ